MKYFIAFRYSKLEDFFFFSKMFRFYCFSFYFHVISSLFLILIIKFHMVHRHICSFHIFYCSYDFFNCRFPKFNCCFGFFYCTNSDLIASLEFNCTNCSILIFKAVDNNAGCNRNFDNNFGSVDLQIHAGFELGDYSFLVVL